MKQLRSLMSKQNGKIHHLITVYCDNTDILHVSEFYDGYGNGRVSIQPVRKDVAPTHAHYLNWLGNLYDNLEITTKYYCDPSGAIRETVENI